MIDTARLRRLLAVAAGLLAVGGAVAVATGGSAALAGGLALGYALGALPFAFWMWIATQGLSGHRPRMVAAVLLVAKLGVISLALYLLVYRPLVDPVGVLIGMAAVGAVVVLGALAAPAREAA